MSCNSVREGGIMKCNSVREGHTMSFDSVREGGIILYGRERFLSVGNQTRLKYTDCRCFMPITISYGRVGFGT